MSNLKLEIMGNLSCPNQVPHIAASCFKCQAHAKVKELVEAAEAKQKDLEAECAVKAHAIESASSLYTHLRFCQKENCKECFDLANKANHTTALAMEKNSGAVLLKRIKDIDDTVEKLEKLTPGLEKISKKNEKMALLLKKYREDHGQNPVYPEPGICTCVLCHEAEKLLKP